MLECGGVCLDESCWVGNGFGSRDGFWSKWSGLNLDYSIGVAVWGGCGRWVLSLLSSRGDLHLALRERERERRQGLVSGWRSREG